MVIKAYTSVIFMGYYSGTNWQSGNRIFGKMNSKHRYCGFFCIEITDKTLLRR